MVEKEEGEAKMLNGNGEAEVGETFVMSIYSYASRQARHLTRT